MSQVANGARFVIQQHLLAGIWGGSGPARDGDGLWFFFRAWVVWSQTRGGCLWWIGTAIGEVLEAVGQLVGLSMQCRVIAMSIQFSAF